ncbi:MAG: hypothetical protein QXW79_01115 [Thermoplasmata archaeon]
MNESDPFWLNDPSILFRGNNWYKIIPDRKMTNNEILNTLTRFCIYLLIIYLIFAKDKQYFYIIIFIILVIIIIHYSQKCEINGTSENNSFTNDLENNLNDSLDNITFTDLLEKPNIKSSKTSRQFYRVPSNDRIKFAKWLYQSPKTCKEDTSHCLRYEDLRYSRPNPK